MEAIEIPNENRGIGPCRGCRTNHKCSWMIDGQYYCGPCADQKMGVEPEPAMEPEVSAVFTETGAHFKTPTATPSAAFTLTPSTVLNISIGKLANGYVVDMDGESHMFPDWQEFIRHLNNQPINISKAKKKAVKK